MIFYLVQNTPALEHIAMNDRLCRSLQIKTQGHIHSVPKQRRSYYDRK